MILMRCNVKKFITWLSSALTVGVWMLFILAVGFTVVSAVEIPTEPRTVLEFEQLWDYVVANDVEYIEISYATRRTENTCTELYDMARLMNDKYRYVHPEEFNYMRMRNCWFWDTIQENNGFVMALTFEDLDKSAKREYYKVSIAKAKELYETIRPKLTPNLTQKARAQIICDAISEKVFYKDDDTDLCHTAYCALVNGYAVCDGYTSLLNMLLQMDGIECVGRLGQADGQLHSWTYAKLDGEWVNIDETWVDGGLTKYMGITDKDIAATHTTDKSYQELREKEIKENVVPEKLEKTSIMFALGSCISLCYFAQS